MSAFLSVPLSLCIRVFVSGSIPVSLAAFSALCTRDLLSEAVLGQGRCSLQRRKVKPSLCNAGQLKSFRCPLQHHLAALILWPLRSKLCYFVAIVVSRCCAYFQQSCGISQSSHLKLISRARSMPGCEFRVCYESQRWQGRLCRRDHIHSVVECLLKFLGPVFLGCCSCSSRIRNFR
eukprot:s2428_g1.t1